MRGDFRDEAERFRDIDRAVMKQIEEEVEAEAEVQRRAKCYPALLRNLEYAVKLLNGIPGFAASAQVQHMEAVINEAKGSTPPGN
jgi:hypothetical protein